MESTTLKRITYISLVGIIMIILIVIITRFVPMHSYIEEPPALFAWDYKVVNNNLYIKYTWKGLPGAIVIIESKPYLMEMGPNKWEPSFVRIYNGRHKVLYTIARRDWTTGMTIDYNIDAENRKIGRRNMLIYKNIPLSYIDMINRHEAIIIYVVNIDNLCNVDDVKRSYQGVYENDWK